MIEHMHTKGNVQLIFLEAEMTRTHAIILKQKNISVWFALNFT